MRKIILIIVLLLFNFCIVYAKIKSKNLDKVDIRLEADELGIAVILLDNSTSILLKYQGKYIFYLVDYLNDKDLTSNIRVFTNDLNNVYMAFNYNYDAQILKHKVIGDLTLSPNRIKYKDYNICLNYSHDCDIVIALKDDILLNKDISAIIYRTDLDDAYLDYIDSFWIDKYRLTRESYTIITLGDEFSIESINK